MRRWPPRGLGFLVWMIGVGTVTIVAVNGLTVLVWGREPSVLVSVGAAYVAILGAAWWNDRHHPRSPWRR